jgi:DNA-binding LacI/PurR family transcriptional regulator
MKHIGQLVAVSQSTVSRVLSGASSAVPVAEQTRARILHAVAQFGYTPNPLARAFAWRFDDILLAEFVIPSLTTVHQPMDKIARASLQQVLSLISGVESKGHHQTLVPTLAARNSTAPPAKELA